MLEGIDALVALEQHGTLTEAATRLRLTQSALSKRLQVLEKQLGFALVSRSGRKLRLTSRASDFVERAKPLIADLRALTRARAGASEVRFSLALSDSIAASWGPQAVREALHDTPNVHVALHTHRSVLIVESVRLGRYHIGLGTSSAPARDLIEYPVIDEPMVLVHSELQARPAAKLPLISIEPNSVTWRAIKPQLKARHPALLSQPVVTVETFSAALQMVRSGFGNGVVPLGLVMEYGIPADAYRTLARVTRRVSLLTRKTTHHLPDFVVFRERLIASVAARFVNR